MVLHWRLLGVAEHYAKVSPGCALALSGPAFSRHRVVLRRTHPRIGVSALRQLPADRASGRVDLHCCLSYSDSFWVSCKDVESVRRAEAKRLTPAAVWVAAVRCLCGPLPTCKDQTDASAQSLGILWDCYLYSSSSGSSRRVAESDAVLSGKALGKAATLPFERLES